MCGGAISIPMAGDDRFNARNALSGTKLPMSQSQFGVSLGGAIVANRTFYFTNVEQRRLEQSGLATISADNVSAVNARSGGNRLPRTADYHRCLPKPGAFHECAGQESITR